MLLSISETAKLITNAQKIALTGHINPDPDTLGCVLALGSALKKMNKEIVMIIDDDIPDSLSFMPRADEILRPDKFKNIKFDLLIVLDASDVERIGQVATLRAPILNIDHHISNTHFADYLLLDTQAAATGEIVYRLLSELGTEIDLSMAVNLYTAIATDCGFFKYANTKPQTMYCAAKLLDIGVKPNEISDRLEATSKENIILLTEVLKTMEFFSENKIAVISLPQELVRANTDTEGFIQYPRCIDGVEVAVFCKYVAENITRISMRSKNTDVSKVALSFGGGGHQRAAGCTVYEAVETAKQQIITALNSALAADPL